jgi:hypothetical protein
MPADLAPLCPTCLGRVVSWTAAACPSCGKSSPVAACDACLKSRAGAYVPAASKAPAASGSSQRFLCVDCMEKFLEQEVTERLRDSLLAVAITVVAVFATRAHPAFIYALFVACAACLLFWWLAARSRRHPGRHPRSAWTAFRRRLDRAIQKRARATR